MTVTKQKSGKVTARYIRTHTNHTPGIAEAKHLPLPEVVKREVREKHGQSVQLDSILDGIVPTYCICSMKLIYLHIECIYIVPVHVHMHFTLITGIRGNLTCRENRKNFMSDASRATRQDARNIIRTLDNAVKHRHENDALSVDRLCRELRREDESVIIAYKPQGKIDEAYPSLGEDSLLLVIMTNYQATAFEKHSRKIVCVDSTHKTNPYGFKLVTVVVPDEFKNGMIVFHVCSA